MRKSFVLAYLSLMVLSGIQAQSLTQKYAAKLSRPKSYICYQTAEPLIIDGQANEPSWKSAPYTDAFMDIRGVMYPAPNQQTRVKMLWDAHYLYVFAELDEKHLWSNLTQRDTIVYYDNDFEVFIDPQGTANNYFEIETNARAVVFDLSLTGPYRNPRRPFIQFQWNCPGLKLATYHRGTLNNPTDTDEGWNVEMAIPREAIASEFDNYLQTGNYLRVNFSRVEWQFDLHNGRYDRKKDENGKYLPEDNWVWSPQGEIAMHMPERWGYVYLSGHQPNQPDTFSYPEDEAVRRFLWMLYYAQEEQFNAHKSYYKTIEAFSLSKEDWSLLPQGYSIEVEATRFSFYIKATSKDGKAYLIDQSGYCAPLS